MVVSVTTKISEMRKQMINAAKEYDLNFQHPDTIGITI
ncbi:Spo0E family sporulation regulatory protein-aspartic acid phosphatase [Aneurinibacillus sp. Ricciae_BoGa-3]